MIYRFNSENSKILKILIQTEKWGEKLSVIFDKFNTPVLTPRKRKKTKSYHDP